VVVEIGRVQGLEGLGHGPVGGAPLAAQQGGLDGRARQGVAGGVFTGRDGGDQL
jgi:hypothetical protein